MLEHICCLHSPVPLTKSYPALCLMACGIVAMSGYGVDLDQWDQVEPVGRCAGCDEWFRKYGPKCLAWAKRALRWELEWRSV